MSSDELILYTFPDGAARTQLRAVEGTVWPALNQIADLFGRDKSDISRFLDPADLRARSRQTMRLSEWKGILDDCPQMNDLSLLASAGSVSATQAERVAHEHYGAFDAQRKEELAAGGQSEIVELERIAEQSTQLKKRGNHG